MSRMTNPSPATHIHGCVPAVTRETCAIYTCPACRAENPVLTARLLELMDSTHARKSHYFGGRFENIYLPHELIPRLALILDTARRHAAQLLNKEPCALQLGFWFNIMHAGDVTQPHTHDDDDELLSGTYYLQVPPGSGSLILHLPGGIRSIAPREGQFVLFHPAVEHEVTEHQGCLARISVGFNIGARRETC